MRRWHVLVCMMLLILIGAGQSAAQTRLWPVDQWGKLGRSLSVLPPNHTGAFTLVARDAESAKTLAGELGAEPPLWNVVRVNARLDELLAKLLFRPEVVYIGHEAMHPDTESRIIGYNLNVNTINAIRANLPMFNGKGRTLSVKEESFNPADIDLRERRRFSGLEAAKISTHATDMATIAAGAGNSFITGLGVAPAAWLTSSDFATLLPDRPEDYDRLDAWVQCHAYGTEVEDFYGASAMAYDRSANEQPNLLHVFSAGNRGLETNTTGPYAGLTGYAALTGNFKQAKNVLVIGAVDTLSAVAGYSSRGPAYDGRIKPDLVAYCGPGTSNSAALVSGLAVLMQQLHQLQWGELPPSALLRALLVTGARDVGPPGPDYLTGFGNVDGWRTMNNLFALRHFSGAVGEGRATEFNLAVPARIRELKVSLVWNDPAAAPNAPTALVNDLDLEVIDPNGQVWQPWTLNPAPSALEKPAMRGVDRLNTIEQVSVDFPVEGEYTIRVRGHKVDAPAQDFYLAYNWEDLEYFQWDFPARGDNLPFDGESGGFRWRSRLNETEGRLEYSTDGGASWQLIEDNVDLSTGYYAWSPPRISAGAIARMTVAGDHYPTSEFTISRPPRLSVGYICEDSLLVYWPFDPAIDYYELYTLPPDSAYLVATTITTDTLLVLAKNELPDQLLMVRPYFADDRPALRSYTYDYEQLGAQCYILSLFTEAANSEGLPLQLQLGTSYGADYALFERRRKAGEGFEVMDTLRNLSILVNWTDRQPHHGLNTYRVRLRLSNGRELLSDLADGYFLRDAPWMVFPNPVGRQDFLNLLSDLDRVPRAVFRLFDSQGRQVVRQEADGNWELIPLTNLPAGLYHYVINGEGQRMSGKVVVY